MKKKIIIFLNLISMFSSNLIICASNSNPKTGSSSNSKSGSSGGGDQTLSPEVQQKVQKCKTNAGLDDVKKEMKNVKKILQQIEPMAMNVQNAADVLYAITNPQGENRFSIDCYGGKCPQFTWSEDFSSNVGTVSSNLQNVSDRKDQKCTTNLKLTNPFVAFGKGCQDGQCVVQCGEKNCTASKCLDKNGQPVTCTDKNGKTVTCTQAECSQKGGSSAKFIPGNNLVAQVNTYMVASPWNPLSAYTLDGRYVQGCECATPKLSLENLNRLALCPDLHKKCDKKSNTYSESACKKAQKDCQGNLQYEIIMQCPLCVDMYAAQNNLIMQKYKVLKFIQDALQNEYIKKALNKLITNCQNQDGSSSSNSSSSNSDPCKDCKHICECIKGLNLSNLTVNKPKKQNIHVPANYIGQNAPLSSSCSGQNCWSCEKGEVWNCKQQNSKDENYCILQDTNKAFQLMDIAKFLNAVNCLISQIFKAANKEAKAANQKYKSCINQIVTNYQLSGQNQSTLIQKDELQLLAATKQATQLGIDVKIISIVNTLVSVGMMMGMLMPESITNAITGPLKDLYRTMKAQVRKLFGTKKPPATLEEQVTQSLEESQQQVEQQVETKIEQEQTSEGATSEQAQEIAQAETSEIEDVEEEAETEAKAEGEEEEEAAGEGAGEGATEEGGEAAEEAVEEVSEELAEDIVK